MATEAASEIPVRVVSGYGARTEQPFVLLVIGEHMTQMPPAKAREIAGLLLECAEAADQDAFLVRFGMRHIGLDLQQAITLLGEFREARKEEEAR